MGQIVVGTSSWADPGFVEDWYPPDLPARDRLSWYAERFQAVEVNSSFYAIPDRNAVRRWAEVTPDGFTFDVKVHRLLSRHGAGPESLPKDLRQAATLNERGRVVLDPELEAAIADRILEELAPLVEAGKLSAFLVQLSPAFAPGPHRLEELDGLIERLAPHRVAVELRHRGWVTPKRREETLGHLADRGAAFVTVDAPRGKSVTIMPPIDAVTTSRLAYFRAHGRNERGYVSGKTVAERFGWQYSDEELGEHRERLEALSEQADEVRAMYNNNSRGDAPAAARRMRELLGQDPGPPPGDAQGRLA